MKSHHLHRQSKPHLLLTLTLLLLSLVQSQNPTHNFSSQRENLRIALEDERQIQSSFPKSSDNNGFLLNTGAITPHFLQNEKNSFLDNSNRDNSPANIGRILIASSKKSLENAHTAQDLERESEIYPIQRNEPDFGDYELLENPREITMEKKCENFINKMWINFDPLRFKYFKSTDSILYQIQLSDNAQGFDYEKTLGAWNEEPYEILLSLDHLDQIRVFLYNASESYYTNYYIRIKAFVIRDSQKIFSFTYPIGHKNLQLVSFIGIASVGIVSFVFTVTAAILSYKGFQKAGAWSKRRGKYEAIEEAREESPVLNGNEESLSDV